MSLEQAIKNLADAINNHADAIRQTGQTLLPLNEVTLDDLRKVSIALLADGKKTEFLTFLKGKFDAPNISALKSEQYPECLDGLENLLGKKLSDIAVNSPR